MLALAVLAFAVLLSLAVGARSIPFGEVIDALRSGGDSKNAAVVNDVRVPRTLLGIAVGVALGLAGALMQALTRNPLADPGLLGVNAGAAAAVVIAIGWLGVTGSTAYIWFAFLGAGLASVAVYAIGSAGRGGATPVRLALAGTALSVALTALDLRHRAHRQPAAPAVQLLVGRRARRPRAHGARRDRPVRRRGRDHLAVPGQAAQRAGARRRLRACARGARRTDPHRRSGRDHAAVRRRDRGGRPDLLPRPDRAARGARDLRAGPALGARLLGRARRARCCSWPT